AHHTVEDTALALGQALREALGDKAGICRFGDALVPLDETLAQAAVDLSGRPYAVHSEPAGMSPLIGTYDTTLTRHFFESLAMSAGICVHLNVLAGRNPHHIVEAQFKAFARPLLGICVGMQVLFAEGVEHGQRTAGCAEWPGVVDRLAAPVLPHMGWNTVQPPAGSRLMAGIGPQTRFYFVHSYAARSLPLSDTERLAQPLTTWATHGVA